jgi:flagellin-like protein
MNLRKKAVSPLIATVLLVMITVSIGAAIMVVIQGITESQFSSIDQNKQLIKCGNDIKAKVFRVGDTSRICYNLNDSLVESMRFAIVLENNGFSDINDFKFTAVGDNITEVDGGFAPLPKGAKHGYGLDFSVSGTLESLIISPKVAGTSPAQSITCELTNLEWDSSSLDTMSNCRNVTWDDALNLD